MSRLADLLDARARRKRELLEELRPLGQDAATPEMQSAAYREALHEERRSVEAQIRHAQMLAPSERVDRPFVEPHDRETASARAARLTDRLAAIDTELARVEEQ